MALTLNPATRVFTILQADLTFVSGSLYELDTNQFRKDAMDLLASENYIWMPDAYSHNQEVTVAGITYARTLEFINSYSIQFEDTGGAYSVRLIGSNNNLFDVENSVLIPTDKVTVISTNSAGLQTVVQGSGVTTQDKADIRDLIMQHILADSKTFAAAMAEVFARLDLDSTKPNTYANDGSKVFGSDFTLTRTDNGTNTKVQRS